MTRTEVGRIVVGEAYEYHRGGRYEVLALAWDPVHLRDLVIYAARDGADAGQWYVCSPADFVNKFLPVEERAGVM